MNNSTTTQPEKLEHFVNDAPFDPRSIEQMTPAQEAIFLASQKKLMWWKFKKHKVAVLCGGFLLVMYLAILISEFLAPYALETRDSKYIYAPPQSLHFIHEGEFVGPFVYKYKRSRDMKTLKRLYAEDTAKPYPIRFFCTGDKYKFWGLIEGNFHLMCPPEKKCYDVLVRI